MSELNLTKEELKHYIKKIKEHEANRTSTNKRNKYWEKNTPQATPLSGLPPPRTARTRRG